MTRGGTGTLPPELVKLLDLIDRLGRQAHKFVESLSPAQLCELAKQAATLRAVTPRPFTHLGAVVRWLREAAGLSRTQLEAQTGLCAATLRNLEKDRHQPTAATLRKLLKHPAMRALPPLAQEAGLSLEYGGMTATAGSPERK